MSLSKQRVALILGPLIFAILQFLKAPSGMSPEGYSILTATIWIAIWWVFEAVPISVTAFLPIILFPLSGAVNISDTTAAYGHKYIFLYIGGFFIAKAIEKWNLHKRIALNIIHVIGTNSGYVILGFMVATAFLSMWISNTATSVMMLPIGMSIVAQLNENKSISEIQKLDFGKALMLGIAYSASIGGMATLIGTPPNLVFAAFIKETYGTEISFWQWFKFGLPIAIPLLIIGWLYLTRIAFKINRIKLTGGKKEITKQLNALGSIGKEEKHVLIVFVATAFAWITRSFILQKINPFIDDSIIALIAGVSLFIIYSKKSQKPLLSWEEAVQIPWGIIILFGGGMALAAGFESSGLALWLGQQMEVFKGLPFFLMILLTITLVNFITEVTSNLATIAMLLPILAPIALTLQIDPYTIMIAATVAASCAFMLPVATPPNAVVFGSGLLKISDMMRAGIWMNLISIIVLSIMVYFFLPLIWNV
jgi:sodium-dependent dicarboxylate transporter 2/3/5